MKAPHQIKLLILTLLVIVASLAFAAVPQTINYQGYLKDSTGVPVSAPTSVRFSLYSSNPPRNDNYVWRETKSVTLFNGIYSTQLGSATPITAPFDVPYWLGVKVAGDAEMPLQALASAPYAWRAAIADVVATGGVTTPTLADSSVTTAKIASGAVTDSHISGTISAAKLDLSGVQQKYAKVAVVAQSGGDYSDPVTAMSNVASWCGTPSGTNPCLLKIMPGVYDLGSGTLAMQQYVDIEGSGELSTIITSAISVEPNGTVRGANNSELRSLEVRNTAPHTLGVWGIGIANVGSSPRISHVTVTTSVASISCGIYNSAAAAPIISDVKTTAAGVNASYGIANKAAEPTLTNVTTSALGVTSSNYGILNSSSSPRLVNVIATAAGGPSFNHGMFNTAASGSYTIHIDRSTFEGSSSSISGTSAGYTLIIGASKLLGPIGSTGTYHYFASYSDSSTLDSATIGTRTFQTGADGNKGVIVKGNSATQSANLQEWQDSSGTAVASVSPAGVFSGSGSGLTSLNAGNVSSGILPIAQGGTGASSATTALSNLGAVAKAGDTMTGDLTMSNASINLPPTTATTGMIRQWGVPLIHTYGSASNFFAGISAGNLTTTGTENTAFGGSALSSNATGSGNTASGLNSLAYNTTGSNNSAYGSLAGVTSFYANANSTGNNNTFIGAFAGPGSPTQLNNATAIGYMAMVNQSDSLVLGSAGVKVGIGTQAPAATLTVVNNAAASKGLTVQGAASQSANLQEWQNSAGTVLASVSSTGVFSGNGSGLTGLNAGNMSSGILPIVRGGTGASTAPTALTNLGAVSKAGDTMTGDLTMSGASINLPATSAGAGMIRQEGNSLLHTYGGISNFFAGRYAGNLTTTGDNNTATGGHALNAITDGNSNSAFGYMALAYNTSGSSNTAIGDYALHANILGSENVAIGEHALFINTNASSNTAIGMNALYSQSFNNSSNLWYSNNTAVGFAALSSNNPTTTSNGINNTALGYLAGSTATQANANTTGFNNTFIGANSGPGTPTQLTNATAVGYNALVSQSNSLVLGGTGSSAVKVGIGTQSPAATLTVVNSASATKGLTVQGATSQSANLQEWQNSAGTVLASVSSAGVVSLPSNGLAVGTNQLVVSGGHVGIGKSPGSDFLDLAGTMRMNDNQVYLRGSGDTLHGVGWYTANGFVTGSMDGPVVYGCGGGTLGSTCGGNRAALTWDNASNVNLSGTLGVASIPTGTTSNFLCSSGANSGTLQRCGSSRRLKDNIADLPFGLDTVNKLRPVSFTWKANGNKDFGFIAEEVAELNPVFAIHNEQGEPDGVKYANMSALLVKAVQEQQVIIEGQKAEIDSQKVEIEQLKADMVELKRLISLTSR